MTYKSIFIALFSLVVLGSCVSQKKYDELLAKKVKTEGDLAEATEALDAANAKISRLEKQVAELSTSNDKNAADLKKTSEELAKLKEEHEKLEKMYQAAVSSGSKLNRDLLDQQKRLLQMEESLESTRLKNEELASNLREREQRVAELEKILADKEKAVNDLRNKVTQALLSFKESDLTVDIKNGKVYVSLSEQLLFKSGSTAVDPKGVSALQQLARVLREQSDINVVVEGHTDNVPISRTSQYMNDNWDLSVMRATSIVRILTREGVNPKQITASGKGEHLPITGNASAEEKAKNRRTEIILTPKLDELFQILEGY